MKSFSPSLILLCICLVVGVLFIWPSYGGFSLAVRHFQEKKQEVDARAGYYNALSNAHNKLQNFPNELKKINTTIPGNTAFPSLNEEAQSYGISKVDGSQLLPSLYNEIQGIASVSGFALKETTSAPMENADGGPIKATEIRVPLEGTYEGLKAFIEQAQNAPRMLSVESVSFRKGDKDGNFMIELKLKAYSY